MSEPVVGSDYCTSELVAATSAGATTLLVTTPTEAFPTLGASEYFYLTIVDAASYAIDANPPVQREIVKVTAVASVSTGYSLTCVRGSGDTTAQIWAAGAVCEIRPCQQWFEDLKSSEGTSWGITDGITTVSTVESLFVDGGVVSDFGGTAAGLTTAPPGASYLTLGTNTTLTNERVLTAGTNITFTDGGAGSTLTINATASSGIGWVWYGTGEDGAAVMDGSNTFSFASKSGNNYTLTRSVQLTNLTIDAGCTLDPDSYAVYCSGTLTNNGTIKTNGSTGQINATTTGRTANCYGGSTGCDSGQAGTNANPALGGAGGNGGTDDLGNAGQAGGTVTLPTEATGGIATAGSIYTLTTGRQFNGTVITGGAAGGTGHATAGNPFGGGGGGTGGGVIPLFALAMAGNGSIQANGGSGATAVSAGCGGGGGGGGGVIIVITNTSTWRSLYTLAVTAGSGGAGGGGTGGSGSAGSSGRILG